MNIPAITSINDALKIYYNNSEIGNKEIKELFGSRSPTTISRLKSIVKEEMRERNVVSYGIYKINTRVAFDVWGINVTDLENRKKKMDKLKLS